MITIELFKKPYRELRGMHRNMAINKIREIFTGIKFRHIERAVEEINPFIYFSYEHYMIKFEPQSFARLCDLIHKYEELLLKKEMKKESRHSDFKPH